MRRGLYAHVAVVAALVTGACDSVPLLAPTNSSITLTAPNRVLPLGGTTEVSAMVLEQSGTPVQNGTMVRFTTTLGIVSPAEVETRNGLAVATFSAGQTSGIAEVRATSGGATGGTTTSGTGTTATTTSTNVMQITIGAAAVNTITLRANPGTVSSSGGNVELIANVVAENGRALEGILVTFNSDQGSLSSSTAVTNAAGDARTTLTTTQKATITATAGTKTSTPALTVDVRIGPGLTVTCAPTSGTGNCAAVQASFTGNIASVLFTVSKATGTSNLRSAVIDFGDGTSQNLGNLASTTSVPHSYAGPQGGSQVPRPYSAVVTAVDVNGETTAASTTVNVTPQAIPTPLSVSLTATGDTATAVGQRWAFTATVAGGGEGTAVAPIASYAWDFGDGTEATTSSNATSHIYSQSATGERYTVTVTARTTDGRTAQGRTEIIAGKFP